MFAGNWLINLCLAFVGFIIVFSASFSQNLLSTSFYRAIIAFVFSFLIGYLFRYLFAIAMKNPTEEGEEVNNPADGEKKEEIKDPNLLSKQELELNDDEIYKASQFVKNLLDNEEV